MGVAEFIMIGTKAHGQRGKRSIESLKRHLMENLFSYETNELKADNTEKIWFSWCKRRQWLIKTTVYVRKFPESHSKEKIAIEPIASLVTEQQNPKSNDNNFKRKYKKIIDHLDEIKVMAKQINKLWQWFSYLDKRRNTVHLQGLFALALRY